MTVAPAFMARGLKAVFLLLAATLAPLQTAAAADVPKTHSAFGDAPASVEARALTSWVMDSGDNRGLPFVVIDKSDARVFVFDSTGQLLGVSAALLGLAVGDESAEGIGERALADIRPDERTTPAGRFIAGLGNNLGSHNVLWVDYENAVSLHRVITTSRTENRLQRLETETPLDNRISYGCINVPADFFESVVVPVFTGTAGIVYIMPETRALRAVFTAFEVE